MNDLMIFEGHEVEVFELNGEILFNPYHVGVCLDMATGTVKDHMSKMNKKQVIKVKFGCRFNRLPKIEQCRRKFSHGKRSL